MVGLGDLRWESPNRRELLVVVAEWSPTLTTRAPGRTPAPLVDHITTTGLTERHWRSESTSTVAGIDGERLADDRVRGRASAVRTTCRRVEGRRLGLAADDGPRRGPLSPTPGAHVRTPVAWCSVGRRIDRHGAHSHQSGMAPGKRSGSPGNTSRQRPHCRGIGGKVAQDDGPSSRVGRTATSGMRAPSGVRDRASRPVTHTRGSWLQVSTSRHKRRTADSRSASRPASLPEESEHDEGDDDDTEDKHGTARFPAADAGTGTVPSPDC